MSADSLIYVSAVFEDPLSVGPSRMFAINLLRGRRGSHSVCMRMGICSIVAANLFKCSLFSHVACCYLGIQSTPLYVLFIYLCMYLFT